MVMGQDEPKMHPKKIKNQNNRNQDLRCTRQYQPPKEQCNAIVDINGRALLTSNIQVPGIVVMVVRKC